MEKQTTAITPQDIEKVFTQINENSNLTYQNNLYSSESTYELPPALPDYCIYR